MDDNAFLRHVADRLAGLPGVKAVALGGSRAQGTRRPVPHVWWDRAGQTFGYALAGHAPYGRLAQCAGPVAQAASQAAHAVLAARSEWITNEKHLLTRAGLRQVDQFLAAAGPDPDVLRDVVRRARDLCCEAVQEATAGADGGNAGATAGF